MTPLPTADVPAGYDLSMELLCTLQLSPLPISRLAADLNVNSTQLYSALKQLRTYVCPIHSCHDKNLGRVAWISLSDWELAQRLGEEYWARVYPD